MEFAAQSRIVIASNGVVTPLTVNPQLIPYIGLPLADNQVYVIDTPTSLIGNASIALDGGITPFAGMKFSFRYMGRIATPNSHSVTIFGQGLTILQMNMNLLITATYALATETNSAQWIVSVAPLQPLTTDVQGADVTAINAARKAI